MVDVDTFLTPLYVMADDLCKTSLPPEPHPGPQAALSRSAVVTLALCGQWQSFGSERGFYRYAQRHLRPPCRLCPPGSSAIGTSASSTRPSWRFFCIASDSWPFGTVPMKLSIAPGSLSAMRSVAEPDGCRAWPIWVGAIGWAGMQAAICSSQSPPGG